MPAGRSRTRLLSRSRACPGGHPAGGHEDHGDRSKAFVALGPANRVAVIDAQTYEVEDYLLVGQRVWQLAFSPDEKFLYTTNGVSNYISVIDVENDEVTKSIAVGSFPWGIAVKDWRTSCPLGMVRRCASRHPDAGAAGRRGLTGGSPQTPTTAGSRPTGLWPEAARKPKATP